MDAAAAPTNTPAVAHRRFAGAAAGRRVVGAAAIGLAVSLTIQNAVAIATDAPAYGSPIEHVFAYHAANGTAVAFAVGLEALNLPLLLGFLAGVHELAGRCGAGRAWSLLAMAAGAALSAVLALYAVLWIGVVLSAGRLTEPGPTFQLAWQLHAAAFALALPALGTTFLGATLAAHAAGLTPAWQRLVGIAGSVLLIGSGTASLAIADGSGLLLVGMAGYAAWLAWLIATGVRLLRAQPGDREEAAVTVEAGARR